MDEQIPYSDRPDDGKGGKVVPMRLQKFLARAGVASRRASENLMSAGRVTVNGDVVRELGSKVDPLVDVVCVDGRVVELSDSPTTIMLHKPAGVITTMKAQSEDPIVADLVPTDQFPGLYPIGRLDADSTGLLLFSTDGELGNALLHPSKHVSKTYIACIEGHLNSEELKRVREGIVLMRERDGVVEEEATTQPATVEVLARREALEALRSLDFAPRYDQTRYSRHADANLRDRQVVSITITEGRYHQVKRMFEAVGHKVVALHRTTFGPLSLGSLKRGAWRELTAEEVASLTR